MARSVKQTRSVQVCRKNVIPAPRCGAVCEAVMSPLYPAQKSNLLGCPCQTFWAAVWPLPRRGLPGRKNGPTPRSTPLWGWDATRPAGGAQTAPHGPARAKQFEGRSAVTERPSALPWQAPVSPSSDRQTVPYPRPGSGRSSLSETGRSPPGRRLPSSRPELSFQPGRGNRASSFPCRRHGTG